MCFSLHIAVNTCINFSFLHLLLLLLLLLCYGIWLRLRLEVEKEVDMHYASSKLAVVQYGRLQHNVAAVDWTAGGDRSRSRRRAMLPGTGRQALDAGINVHA